MMYLQNCVCVVRNTESQNGSPVFGPSSSAPRNQMSSSVSAVIPLQLLLWRAFRTAPGEPFCPMKSQRTLLPKGNLFSVQPLTPSCALDTAFWMMLSRYKTCNSTSRSTTVLLVFWERHLSSSQGRRGLLGSACR